MASCYFLLKQFEDVLIYFNSIKSYFYNDDAFNFNYAQAKAAVGNYKEAEEVNFYRSDIKKFYLCGTFSSQILERRNVINLIFAAMLLVGYWQMLPFISISMSVVFRF